MSSEPLYEIVRRPEAQRDKKWEQEFLNLLAKGKVHVANPVPQAGADGWPYLFVRTLREATEPTERILQWLSEQGIGLLINDNKEIPDFVLTYGMIWNFRERGEFLTATKRIENGAVRLSAGQKIWTKNPDLLTIPVYVRQILLQFFADQNIDEPLINMMSLDQEHYDLCFSLESLGHPDPVEHQGLLEALSWFFPAHYSLMLMSEAVVPRFHALRLPSA
jgi:hypothetical protein